MNYFFVLNSSQIHTSFSTPIIAILGRMLTISHLFYYINLLTDTYPQVCPLHS